MNPERIVVGCVVVLCCCCVVVVLVARCETLAAGCVEWTSGEPKGG